jgi:ATP-dependent DNA helicase RecQ
VEAAISGRDVRVLVPTGGGKSLCYQLTALVLADRGLGPTVVVSPLVALIEDQVRSLKSRGVEAIGLHAGVPPRERDALLRAARGAALVYVSPERAVSARFQRWLRDGPVAALAVDEAHCVSEWGHDFRPEYLQLGSIRALVGGPALALTATATPRVAAEIDASLGLRDPLVVVGDLRRSNLVFSVEHLAGDRARVERLIRELDALALGRDPRAGRVIVYAATRRRVRDVADGLRAAGFKAGWYHAGRTDGARERAQQSFEAGKHAILVATTAFGMGIDLRDVRLVAHVQAPSSLEAYYQQAGRAGRDGREARCLLLYGPSDVLVQERLRAAWPGAAVGWEALVRFAWSTRCRQEELSRWFLPDRETEPCGRCDACTDRGGVERRVADARSGAAERKAERISQQAADNAVTLDDDCRDAIVAFVDALRKPIGRTLAAAALRGSRARKVTRWKLTENPLFAALKGTPEVAIVRAIDQLLASGRLVRAGKKYPTLWIPGKRIRSAVPADRPPKPAAVRALESFRRAQAKQRRWKAYQIFPNATLALLVATRPVDLAGLASIKGMGEKRIASFGEQILEILARSGP